MQNNTLRLSLIIAFLLCRVISGQPAQVEYLGLSGKYITSMGINESVIVIGTNEDGVYYQHTYNLPDSEWVYLGLEEKNVQAVYPHRFETGPISSWAFTVGVNPDNGDSNFIYSSYHFAEFSPNGSGISDSLAPYGIYNLSGFPVYFPPGGLSEGTRYAATGRALFRKLDRAPLWTPVYENLGVEGSGVIQVKASQNLRGLVLAAGSEGDTGILLIKSTDYGDTWEYLYPPGEIVDFDFTVNSSNSDVGTIFASHYSQISRSQDGGSTWEIVYDGSCISFVDVVYEQERGLVFIGGSTCEDTSAAVLSYSDDLGESWNDFQLNMAGPLVEMAISTDYLYFTTSYGGVNRILLNFLSIVKGPIPESFSLHQNYPNPFNPTTTIRFNVGYAYMRPIRLVIYNITGRVVETLINESLTPGEHEIIWNAGNLPSGVYFVQLQSGEFFENKKIVLLK